MLSANTACLSAMLHLGMCLRCQFEVNVGTGQLAREARTSSPKSKGSVQLMHNVQKAV